MAAAGVLRDSVQFRQTTAIDFVHSLKHTAHGFLARMARLPIHFDISLNRLT